MLVSKYKHSIDAKGRVFIPAKYRTDLGERFYVQLAQGGCLRCYSAEEWGNVLAKIVNSTAKSINLRRRLCASTSEVEMDSQGRLLLTEDMRTHAQLTDTAFVVGMGNWAEIWNPEALDRAMKEAYEEVDTDLMDELGIC